MKYSSQKIQSWGKMFGGKLRYSRQYIPLFPSGYKAYIEPFAGGAGIFFNKERSEKEFISEKCPIIYNVFDQLQCNGDLVHQYILDNFYDYSLKTFKSALSAMSSTNKIVKAAATITANRMSSNGQMKRLATQNRLRGGQMGDKNAWENFLENHIKNTIERLQGVTVLNRCAFDIINKNKSKHILYYLDPPYIKETRISKNVYSFEFSNEDHLNLLNLIKDHPSKIFISGYDSDLYNEVLEGWKKHSFERPCDSGQTKIKSRRLEVLWENHGGA